MAGDEQKRNGIATKKGSEPLIETLPDGRHRTNLNVLIRTDEAKEHFKEISQAVKSEKRKPERE